MPLPSAQPLRRSTRNRAAPRNPDSPVTFVQREVDTITVSDSSDSDTASDNDARHIHDDLVQDLQAGIEASAIQQASNAFDTLAPEDTSTVIFGSPSPDPFDEPQEVERITPAAFEAMMRSLRENDGDTTHVHGRNQEDSDDELGGPGGVTVESVDSGDGSLQDRADHLIQHIVRLQNRNPRDILLPAAPIPSPVGPPRTEAPSSTRFTALEDAAAHDGAVFQRLQAAGGPVGRALAALTDRGAFYVGTSDFPVDIAHDYANHQHNFREINSLLDLENTYSGEFHFLPIPSSAARSALLESQRALDDTPVFVLYVYHQDAEPLRGASENQPSASMLAMPDAPAATAARTAPMPTASPIETHLRTRFAAEYSELAGWRASSYGSAYMHCLTERGIQRICQSLGIGLLGRTLAPAHVGSMVIRMDDVVTVAGINLQTFSTYRTELRQIKDAHLTLRRLHRAGALPDVHQTLFNGLEVMLGVRTSGGASADAEFSVVRWTISWLMGQVRSVLDDFANV
ncbi:hypothetical protein FB451DRAFT_1370418 [Mycena latifolia]|nr:hypothetical protein FB451DRAFT_1370418 [Mycena latifolia]